MSFGELNQCISMLSNTINSFGISTIQSFSWSSGPDAEAEDELLQSSEPTLPEPVIAEDELLRPDPVDEVELLRADSPVPAAAFLLRADSPSPVPPANPMLPAYTETVLHSPLQWRLLESNTVTPPERQPSPVNEDQCLMTLDHSNSEVAASLSLFECRSILLR